MKSATVTMVRIYLTEEKAHLQQLMEMLHDREKVRGVTAFRGISGFGKSGVMHSASLLDLSLNLPVIIEFFDTPEKVAPILEHLHTIIEPGHLVSWSATVTTEA